MKKKRVKCNKKSKKAKAKSNSYSPENEGTLKDGHEIAEEQTSDTVTQTIDAKLDAASKNVTELIVGCKKNIARIEDIKKRGQLCIQDLLELPVPVFANERDRLRQKELDEQCDAYIKELKELHVLIHLHKHDEHYQEKYTNRCDQIFREMVSWKKEKEEMVRRWYVQQRAAGDSNESDEKDSDKTKKADKKPVNLDEFNEKFPSPSERESRQRMIQLKKKPISKLALEPTPAIAYEENILNFTTRPRSKSVSFEIKLEETKPKRHKSTKKSGVEKQNKKFLERRTIYEDYSRNCAPALYCEQRYISIRSFRYSRLHATFSSIPCRIPGPIRPKRKRRRKTSLIPIRVDGPVWNNLSGKSIPFPVSLDQGSKLPVKGFYYTGNQNGNAVSPNLEERKGVRFPEIRKPFRSRIPVRIPGYIWSSESSNSDSPARKAKEDRRWSAPSKIPVLKSKADVRIPRLDPDEHLPAIDIGQRVGNVVNGTGNNNFVIVPKKVKKETMSVSEKKKVELERCNVSHRMVSKPFRLPPINRAPTPVVKIISKGNLGANKLSPLETYSDVSMASSPLGDGHSNDSSRTGTAAGFSVLPPIETVRKSRDFNRPLSAEECRSTPFLDKDEIPSRPWSASSSQASRAASRLI